MNNEINAHCSICGNGYHVCMSCQESKLNPWRSIVDTSEHYKIYMTIASYENKYIDIKEAKDELNNCDLTGKEEFIEEIKNKIDEIFAYKEEIEDKTELYDSIKDNKGNIYSE